VVKRLVNSLQLSSETGHGFNNSRISRKKVARTQDRQSNHTYRSISSSGLDGFWRCSFCKLGLYSSSRGSLFVLFLLRRLRASIIFPLAPAVEVNESLHAAPFGDFALHPCKVYRLGITRVSIVSASGAQLEMQSHLRQEVVASGCQRFMPVTL
jgi:hypothetical protein